MRTRVALLVGAVLLAGLAMAGAATATQADAQLGDEQINGTDGDNGTDVGICMIGVDSACNGEQWDGDNETTDSDAKRIGDDENQSDDSAAGICMVGAGGPCNSDNSSSDSSNLTPANDTDDERRRKPGHGQIPGERERERAEYDVIGVVTDHSRRSVHREIEHHERDDGDDRESE